MTETTILKIDNFYIKREDFNPSGSAKDRAIVKQLDRLKMMGYKSAVISSTGNAAISALFYCQQMGIELDVFVSNKIKKEKLNIIKKYQASVHLSPRPISDAFKFGKLNNKYNLRQSTDPAALEGYGVIGEEIMKQLPQVTSVLAPVGSGTTLLGISKKLAKSVKIWAVQPAAWAPVANNFDHNYIAEDRTSTDALGAKLLPLKYKLLSEIRQRAGGGLVIEEADLLAAEKLLYSGGIVTSSEGAMAAAGVKKAKQEGFDLGDYPLVILTGVKR